MDSIIYTVLDDERKVTLATYSKDDAHAAAGRSGTVNPVVHDPEKVSKSLLSMMSPVERLCLEYPEIDEDTIVYVIVGNGGGVDGMDASDKGGGIRYATFHRDIAERKVDGWVHLGEPLVLVPAEVAMETMSRLSPVEALCLETYLDSLRDKPAPRSPSR